MTSHAAKTLPGNEYHIWMPNGLLVSATGSKLYQIHALVCEVRDHGPQISRIAVSADGKQVAIVSTR